ncbi:hypothetical protein [Pseudoalteromonas luteoviolacea]|uniref:Secreted protein n=1 Tax=Pseudoalteromonas luteoviolacea NCIMB 1942 TaxID=1365253 RepID=A0A166XZS9_9GAMM|nr:hypothetical protein [Pseudoalteromonas luteoviolacea]KZN41081.1 hypothetical protein N482_20760 [Pseudoalteromonas luteoviolacea NCIMB 1942]KZW99429.1 hypothetical protein JL49_17290 [Pseudoalteromonas luteoviolacea]
MRIFHVLFALSFATLLCVTTAGANAADERQQVVEVLADIDVQLLDIDLDDALTLGASSRDIACAECNLVTRFVVQSNSALTNQIRAPPTH